jgi:hypothetical protein
VKLAGQGGGGLVDEGGEGETAPTGRRGARRPKLAGARRIFLVAWRGGTETGVAAVEHQEKGSCCRPEELI